MFFEEFIRRLTKKASESLRQDGLPSTSEDPYYEAHFLINDYLNQISNTQYYWQIDPTENEAGKAILGADALLQPKLVVALLSKIHWLVEEKKNSQIIFVCKSLLSQLLKKSILFSDQQMQEIIKILASPKTIEWDLPVGAILQKVQPYSMTHPLSNELQSALQKLKTFCSKKLPTVKNKKIVNKIEMILGEVTSDNITLLPGECWSDDALSTINSMSGGRRSAWISLFNHARTASTSTPTMKWLEKARTIVDAIGENDVIEALMRWFSMVGKHGKAPGYVKGFLVDDNTVPLQENSDFLKGMVWCCSVIASESLMSSICDLGEVCFKKIPNFGARCAKVGNACLYTLGAAEGMQGVAQLARLKRKVKYPSAQKLIEKALRNTATKLGLLTADLEEIAVPFYGLDENGQFRQQFGDFTAELRISGTNNVEIEWINEKGKIQKSIPKSVKEGFGEDLKAIRKTTKDILAMLPAHRDRIERLYFIEKSWDFRTWRERYLDHPLIQHLSRRLIWQFQAGENCILGSWYKDQLVGVYSKPLDFFEDSTRVSLWHPIGFEVSTIVAWRDWLEEKQITQPFKQAHREVYILTDAELQTNTYSNRFAAHIIKQHQFNALCQQRGWKYKLMGNFDSFNTPVLELNQHRVKVEFWVESNIEETSGSGIFLYVSTDQVRFCGEDGQPKPLLEIPARLFSEVMRDVDLFVGVCSIANDPTWGDRGEAPGGAYWQSFSFGDLSMSAIIRKAVLSRLLPRLKIADRCSIKDNFLIVNGQIRTYKIHLGSGNILMEPGNSYLCIVPDRSSGVAPPKVFLPFEGDHTLSIILSKAFMLAEDKKIKDSLIVSQITRKS